MFAFYEKHDDECQNIFTCRSSFTPYVPPEEKISLQDHIPESVREEKKKSGGVEYLPGERLLIQLGKQRQKTHKTKQKTKTLDIERVTQSLSRVLATF
jgi:hypothetical protein